MWINKGFNVDKWITLCINTQNMQNFAYLCIFLYLYKKIYKYIDVYMWITLVYNLFDWLYW